jgi:hypothetical protein
MNSSDTFKRGSALGSEPAEGRRAYQARVTLAPRARPVPLARSLGAGHHPRGHRRRPRERVRAGEIVLAPRHRVDLAAREPIMAGVMRKAFGIEVLDPRNWRPM